MMRRKLLSVLLLPLAACQDVPVEPETPYTGPVNVSVVAAPTSFVACGEQIPVTVTVTGTNGKPVSGFHLNFNVLEGGGRMFGGAALTNKTGVARDIWTISGTANLSNTLAVRAVDPGTGVGTTYFTQTVTTLSKIAFASNRDGGLFEIYTMYPDGSNLRRLTSTPGQQNFSPAWSPDGSKIAFMSFDDGEYWVNYEIYVINADGSNLLNLTRHENWDEDPTWSPDGSKIAFVRGSEIYTMYPDGSNQTRLTDGSAQDPAWSPDGSEIAFSSYRDRNWEIYLMNADGSNPRRLTDNAGDDSQPAWSPDGSKIAFISWRDGNPEIYVMNADGSNPRRLTNNSAGDHSPTWSPDGSKIAFTSNRDDGKFNYEIYTMYPDGSNQTRLTNNTAEASGTAWSGCTAP